MPRYASLLLLLATVLAAPRIMALSSDPDQPIYLEADSAELHEQAGTIIYRGNVFLTQGSIRMRGDQLVVEKQAVGKLITMTGKPVTFRQQPDGDGEEIHGSSLRAEYYTDTGILIMYEQAVVDQGANRFSSDRIEYDSNKSTVRAGAAASGSDRVHSTIQPRTLDD